MGNDPTQRSARGSLYDSPEPSREPFQDRSPARRTLKAELHGRIKTKNRTVTPIPTTPTQLHVRRTHTQDPTQLENKLKERRKVLEV